MGEASLSLRSHGTLKVALADAVWPPTTQVTVCVPVAGVVVETVLYVHETARVASAVLVTWNPCAELMFPLGRCARAVHCAPAFVLAATKPYREAVMATDKPGGGEAALVADGVVVSATLGVGAAVGVAIELLGLEVLGCSATNGDPVFAAVCASASDSRAEHTWECR